MIAYNYQLLQEATFDQNDTVSQKTGKEFTYTYYIELTQKYRNRTLEDSEYYDMEIASLKYDINRR